MAKEKKIGLMHPVVIVSALGYFVDIYDLLLFSIVRRPSLIDLGVADADILSVGIRLLNYQMIGMLIGGVLWGLLGDKRGRLSVLFGSIILYSLANFFNGMVHSVDAYAVLRFLAGVGLAGELGAAITLVSEVLPKHLRGYGTGIVAGVGILGAVVASLIGQELSWRTAYFVGGGLGIALLILRLGVMESGIFASLKSRKDVPRGDLRLLFSKGERIVRYIACCCLGLPLWYVIGILVTLSPELAQDLGIQGEISAGRTVLFSYLGLCIGDIASGFLSQALGSRRRVIGLFLGLLVASIFLYCFNRGGSVESFYAISMLVGFAAGFWAVFVTVAAEQFGTNLRATVTTTAPNFVRGAIVPIAALFRYMHQSLTSIQSALFVGLLTIAIAFISLLFLKETHSTDLDFVEKN